MEKVGKHVIQSFQPPSAMFFKCERRHVNVNKKEFNNLHKNRYCCAMCDAKKSEILRNAQLSINGIASNYEFGVGRVISLEGGSG
jgi:Zn finger protein HypA/HybF involved in hydrogenase expression